MHPVLKEALERSPVMPVLVIPELSMAKPLAEALASGGLTVFEITLRTACALEAMAVMKQAVPDALIGAGTVTNPERLRDAQAFGADFVVSPGTTESLWQCSQVEQLPILPGFSTASEAMRALVSARSSASVGAANAPNPAEARREGRLAGSSLKREILSLEIP